MNSNSLAIITLRKRIIMLILVFFLCFCGAIIGAVIGGTRAAEKQPGGKRLLWMSLAVLFLLALAFAWFAWNVVTLWRQGKFDI